MSPVFLRLFSRLLRGAQRSGLFDKLRPYIKSYVNEGKPPIAKVLDRPASGEFQCSQGNRFALIPGLRNAIKPGWKEVKAAKPDLPNPKDLRLRGTWYRDSVTDALAFLRSVGFEIAGKSVLEVGCYDGIRTFALHKAGAAKITGSDISRYYLTHRPKDDQCGSENWQSEFLTRLRKNVAKVIYCQESLFDAVEFLEDDITDTQLPDAGYDMVSTWGVFEHVTSPDDLFAKLSRILKPGGISFNEYNPFFALDGGHAACTLDFPWGHASLSTEDFERYIKQFRPDELDTAMGFYTQSLNRMTLHDLKSAALKHGLEILAVIEYSNREHAKILSHMTLNAARALYPSLTVNDLLTPFVWGVFRKPHA